MRSALNEQRLKVFLDRYAMKDGEGRPLEDDPGQMWERVANFIGNDEAQQQKFFDLLRDFKFVPGGRILAGAGTGAEVTFYNCYVIPVETKARRAHRYAGLPGMALDDAGSDSREAIFDTIGLMVDIMSRGGGVGINWSVLRPKGAHLKRVNGTTSGPVSWMDVASRAVGVVEQGGSRRGAAMFMLDDWHPDVLDFIEAKRDFSLITNANVSVAVSDEFMAAVHEDAEWPLVFPQTDDEHYNDEWDGDIKSWTEKGYGVRVYDRVRARDLWQKMAESAWASGEPGVVFLGRYNEQSTAKGVEKIISVNPCGEQGLGAYSVCNLGAMNLDAYVIRDTASDPLWNKRTFDWTRFSRDVGDAIEFLDNAIDKNFYFIPENEEIQMRLRRVGLGVMGLADALIGLGLRYGSYGAIQFTARVFEEMQTAAIMRSVALAKQKGAAPAWRPEMAERPYLAEYEGSALGEQIKEYGLRNIFLLTQAPTGTTSILAGVNSGIEPYFDFTYIRKDRTGEHIVRAPALAKYATEGVPLGDEWVTSNDVTVKEHIQMQAAAQRYIDSSVSKTINGPNSHTVEDVLEAYTLAYASGLKGLAYFRDGSGRAQVLNKEGASGKSDGVSGDYEFLRSEFERVQELLLTLNDSGVLTEWQRPDNLHGTTTKVETRAGAAYVTVNRDASSGRPVEVFFNVGKAGSDVAAMAEALGRLASLALRKGATLGGVANQLEGVGGQSQFNRAIPHAIGVALSAENHSTEAPVPVKEEPASVAPPVASARPDYDLCPECGNSSVVWQEGCSKCLSCGYSAC